jgi:hypothetical protein
LEENSLKPGEFKGSASMMDSLQNAFSVKSLVANRGRLRGFEELYWLNRPAKCKESLARPPSGG